MARHEGVELLLAGGVPDLQLDLLLPDTEVVQLEVDADSSEVLVFEGSIDVPAYEGGLAHSLASDEDDLVDVFSDRGG